MERVKGCQPCILFSLSVLNIVVNRNALLNPWQEIDSVRDLCLSVSLWHTHTHIHARSYTHTYTRKVLGYHLWVLHQLASTQLADKVPNMLPNGPSQMNEILRCLVPFFILYFLFFCIFHFLTRVTSPPRFLRLIAKSFPRFCPLVIRRPLRFSPLPCWVSFTQIQDVNVT